jgi:hypothetical protein
MRPEPEQNEPPTTMQRKLISLAGTAAVLTLAATGVQAQSVAPSAEAQAQLLQRVERLAAELADVKAQLAQLKQQQAPAPAAPAPALAAAPAASDAPAGPATVLTSYGEINYNRPTKASENTQADVRRFVLGLQHRFNERTKFVGELEVEHGVSSASDPGEVEVEQAYIEHQLTQQWAARGGLFLIPLGLLNENHEPTAYYGVERNFVETAIIPTTWREGGLQLVGNLDNGFTVQAGLSTGFDINKWDATSTEGSESPLGAIHQELAQAHGRDLSVFGALNWRGVPGLQLGGGLFTGGASQAQPNAPKARVTLWDLHARWTPERWDLSALYARGGITNTAALNTPLVGNPTLIPKSFDGWYTQAAYKLWTHGEYVLSPFARWEQFNTARSFADLGAGLTPAAGRTERVWTLGANFQISPEVVLKADYQRFREVSDNNRLDLGLGWSF